MPDAQAIVISAITVPTDHVAIWGVLALGAYRSSYRSVGIELRLDYDKPSSSLSPVRRPSVHFRSHVQTLSIHLP